MMETPILDYVSYIAGLTLPTTHPREFDNVIISGAFKCLTVHAGNPIELSQSTYGNLNGIEQLMALNERKSPFDFEIDDIIVVPEQSTYESITIIDSNMSVSSNTQPGTANKTSEHKQSNPGDKSIAATSGNTEHVHVNSTIGKLTF